MIKSPRSSFLLYSSKLSIVKKKWLVHPITSPVIHETFDWTLHPRICNFQTKRFATRPATSMSSWSLHSVEQVPSQAPGAPMKGAAPADLQEHRKQAAEDHRRSLAAALEEEASYLSPTKTINAEAQRCPGAPFRPKRLDY